MPIHGAAGVPPFRGVLLKRDTNQTSVNYSGGADVPWETEIYDIGGFFNVGTSATQIVIPAGVRYVRLTATVNGANVTASGATTLRINKNGSSAYDGVPSLTLNNPTTNTRLTITSPVLEVALNDAFTVNYNTVGDTSSDLLAAGSYFGLEVVG